MSGAWYPEYLGLLAQAKDEQEVFQQLTRSARQLGFEHCSYGMRAPLPAGAPQFTLFSDYPDNWSQRYVSNN